jgi:hypothetical protein
VKDPHGRLLRLALAFLVLPALAFGQSTNEILTVDPDSAPQGTTGLLVTFTLDTDSPPAPPAGVMPTSVTIGTMAGSSATHSSQYVVTGVFTIPSSEPTGAKDAAITFPLPGGGTLTFSKTAAFTVTAGGPAPPAITSQPQSQTVPPGGAVTFTVVASGTEPLRYQWQKNDADMSGATASSYSISPVAESDAGNYRCVVTNDYGSATSEEAVLTVAELPTDGYHVVDTGQTRCYSDQIEITCPQPGQAFYGQDSQFDGYQPSFSLSADGLTVQDAVTGLIWQHSPETNDDGLLNAADKLTWTQAQDRPAALNTAHFGGYDDWRLPTIKELYSLIDFRGTDPSGAGDDTTGLTPFIDRRYFRFAYGQVSAGERIIDSQYASSNLYVGPNQGSEGGKLFGVNFADGRIKGYGLHVGAVDKTFFVQCVRGNPSYGINNFADNGDGTITDRATGLMWSQDDNGSAVAWQQALAWVQAQNAAGYLGHDDWRLPNAKELQSILDYTRAPDAVDPSHQGPAIDPIFHCTQVTNEACVADYPWYWAGTTHGNTMGTGTSGVYVCFGRAMGYMSSSWVDVHGAGAQRSDPKSGSLSNYSHNGCGYYNSNAPQGDAIRIYNYVRLVRDADTTGTDSGSEGGSIPMSIRVAPNPMSRSAEILFTLLAPARVRIEVIDPAGRHLATVFDGTAKTGPGSLSWDARDDAGRPLAAGTYLVRLRAPGGTRTTKLTLLK